MSDALTPGLKAEIDRRLVAKGAARRCEVCHRVLPADAFPPDSVICDACYRLAGVDAWEDE